MTPASQPGAAADSASSAARSSPRPAPAGSGPGSGDDPLSVRARPSSLKHDRGRRTTRTGGNCPMNVHAKSRLIPEPLRALRSENKGQAGASIR